MKRFICGAILVTAFTGCNSRPGEPEFRAEREGLRFVPPQGWSERARGDAASCGQKHDRLLVQYKRLQAGAPAWLRVTVADMPPSRPLDVCLAERAPGNWKRESEVEKIQVGGLPAVRASFVGRWHDRDLRCELVAVRRGSEVYWFSGTWPVNDVAARDQVRDAVGSAVWDTTKLALAEH